MAKRITLKTNSGIRSGGNNFAVNLTPSGDALEFYENLSVRKQKGDSGATNMGRIISGTTVQRDQDGSTVLLYMLDENGRIFRATSSDATPLSSMAERGTRNALTGGENCSIIQSTHGDVLWTSHTSGSPGKVGRIWTGAHSSATHATIMTDSSESFVGLAQTGDYIYNITDGSVGTVTSVGTTTITCSGGLSGGSDNQWESGDTYELFVTSFQTLDGNVALSSTRPRILFNFENSTYVVNESWIEVFDSSLVFTGLFLTFHKGYKGQCAAVNGNRVLIGTNFASKGKLHLWGGFLNDWDYKLDINEEILSLSAYKNGWIVITNRGTLYYTDGYSLQILDRFPDIENAEKFKMTSSGGIVIDDNLYLLGGQNSGTATDFERNKTGFWRYSIKDKDWSLYSLPQATGASIHAGTPGAVFLDSNRPAIFASYAVNDTNASITNPYFISTFNQGDTTNCLLYDSVNFGSEVNVKRVILEIEPLNKEGSITDNNVTTVQAAFGKLQDMTWKYLNARATSSTSSIIEVSGGVLRSDTGHAVLSLEGLNAMTLGFISSIANEDAASEQWTLDQSLNAVTQIDTTCNFLPLYKSESKTVTLSNSLTIDPLIFENIPSQAQYGRNLTMLFYFAVGFNFRIKSIHVDYEETMK